MLQLKWTWFTMASLKHNTTQRFDVTNLNDYDVILGTPWIYQHKVCIGLNPSRILIGSDITLPIIHEANTKPLLSGIVPSNEIIAAREELMAYAEPLY